MKVQLEKAFVSVLTDLGVTAPKVSFEHPEVMAHGDYATSVALAYAKQLGMKPRDLAEKIVDALQAGPLKAAPFVEKIDIAGPGFINLHLSPNFFVSEIAKIVSTSTAELFQNESLKGKVVMLEYTSPNLFKPLHIGNLVGNILGESLSRLLLVAGASVKRINYPSDIGLTVAKGVWGLQKTSGNPKDIKALGEAYRVGNTAYDEAGEEKKQIEQINKALYENSDPVLTNLRKEGIATSLSHLEALCKKLGTRFDTQFFESQSAPLGRDIVLANLNTGVFEKSEGAVVYKGEVDGLHTRVFLNSQGLPTYEAKEVGLFKLKSGAYPNFDISITVTGNEQLAFFKVVFAAIKKVFKDETKGKVLQHVPNGFLTLTTGKMSSRKGNVITGESLIETVEGLVQEKIKDRGFDTGTAAHVAEAVAISAIKYSILRQQMGSNIVFDVEKSLSFEGDSGPYLQYSYARAKSVMKKAEVAGIAKAAVSVTSDATGAADQSVGTLERLLCRFPEVVERASQELQPHHVTTYLTEIASAFNSYYANNQIIDLANLDASARRLQIVAAFATVMKNGLELLAISVLEQM